MDPSIEDFPIIKETIFENPSNNTSLSSKKIRIIHFNDVYNIESRDKEPCGGGTFNMIQNNLINFY